MSLLGIHVHFPPSDRGLWQGAPTKAYQRTRYAEEAQRSQRTGEPARSAQEFQDETPKEYGEPTSFVLHGPRVPFPGTLRLSQGDVKSHGTDRIRRTVSISLAIRFNTLRHVCHIQLRRKSHCKRRPTESKAAQNLNRFPGGWKKSQIDLRRKKIRSFSAPLPTLHSTPPRDPRRSKSSCGPSRDSSRRQFAPPLR